jgi:uncharacterized protein (DUF2267 family)
MEAVGKSREERSPEELEQQRRRRHEARASATYREFLKLASAELGLSEAVLKAVITALEQRLPFDEMADLASQLPYKLRELIASCEEPRVELSPREIGRQEFLELVADELRISLDEAESRTRAVLRVLSQTVSPGEIEQVIHLLPRPLRELWR